MRYIGRWPAFDGEIERHRGGFGGVFGWLSLVLSLVLGLPTALLALASFVAGEASMGLCCGTFALAMAVFGLWPLLRSSSYLLTNERLLVTPRFGSPVAVPLSRINRGRIAVDPLTSTMTIGGEQTIVLRYIRGCRHLWSLLLVPASEEPQVAEIVPAEPQAATATSPFGPLGGSAAEICADLGETVPLKQQQVVLPPSTALGEPVDFLYWDALRADGLNTQKGVAILRPGYFAFLPSAAAHNLVRMTAGAAAGIAADMVASAVAGGAAGAGIHLESKVPYSVLLGHLSQCDTATFDREIGRLASEFNALVWTHGDAVVDREKKILLRGRYFVAVHDRATVVTGSLRRDQLPAYQRLAVTWPEVPDFEYHSVGTIVFFAVLLLFLSVFCGSAVYFASQDHNPLGIVATVLLTLLTLALWVAWLRTVLPKRKSEGRAPEKDLRTINSPRFDR